MNPLSRAIWLLARLGAEVEEQEAAGNPGRLAAASRDRETVLTVPSSAFILQQDSVNVNACHRSNGTEIGGCDG